MYAVSGNINNVPIKPAQLTPDFEIDLDSINNAIDKQTKLIFLCSPNNPSGNLLSRHKILDLLKSFQGLAVIDEAYVDFTDQPSFTELLPLFPNLVVLQTLSKAWGLAAIRLGMCFANEPVIQILNKIKPPYNISILTQQVALQELTKTHQKDAWVAEILHERNRLFKLLPALQVVQKVYPSDANFMLVKVKQAKLVYQKLIDTGIVVRDRSSVILCGDCLRITIGTAEENQQLLTALEAIA
jgi:histidinol-phosphate aminotransferase